MGKRRDEACTASCLLPRSCFGHSGQFLFTLRARAAAVLDFSHRTSSQGDPGAPGQCRLFSQLSTPNSQIPAPPYASCADLVGCSMPQLFPPTMTHSAVGVPSLLPDRLRECQLLSP